ncbi:MAG: hypothetical protein PHZ00_00080 [Candidatus Peribacteraceae bacterium]|nr:hypothetical protein [Candidatus Peribacteraceae bacterium]
MSLRWFFSYGSVEGNWVYPLLPDILVNPLASAVPAAMLSILIFLITDRFIERREKTCVATWWITGMALALLLRQSARFNLSSIIESDVSNGYFAASLRYGPLTVLNNYPVLSELSMHPAGNMPGKILLFHALRIFTTSSQAMGFMLVALACLIGPITYALMCEAGFSKRIALRAMILSLVMPAFVGFMPILNTVTPVIALTVFLLSLIAAHRNNKFTAMGAGLAALILILFEPTPFILISTGVFVIGDELQTGKIRWKQLRTTGLTAIGTMIIGLLTLRILTGFDLFAALHNVAKMGMSFNEADRPYVRWLIPNLKDFFMGAGILPSLVFLLAIVSITRLFVHRSSSRRGKKFAELPPNAIALVIGTVTAVLLLDILGLIRGEAVRHWIFLMPFVMMIAAWMTTSKRWLFIVILSMTILQTSLSLWAIGFVIP